MIRHATIIPSRGRAEYFLKYPDVPVRRFQDSMFNTKLFVRPEELERYEASLRILGIDTVEIVPVTYDNISQKRQMILEYCHSNGIEYLFSPDDDARLYERIEGGGYPLLSMDLDTNIKFFNHLCSICSEEYPFVSVRERFMIQSCKYMYELYHKILVLYFIHVPTFMENNISFVYKDMKVFEDRIVQVQLGMKGYKFLTTAQYCHSQRHEKNTVGGCSYYRTREENMRCAKIVSDDFPHIATYAPKDGWNGAECIFHFKKFLKEKEIPYVPIQDMENFISRPDVYQIGGR